MSDEQKTRTFIIRQSIVDRLTSRIGKIGGLIGAVVVLATGVIQLKDIVLPTDESTTTGPPVADAPLQPVQCVTADMVGPSAPVALSTFSTAEFRLVGSNDCNRKLNVHVAFKVVRPAGVGFKTECNRMPDPECWIVYTIEHGAIDEPLLPPELNVLRPPQTEPIEVNVNWVIFTPDKKRVGAKIASISVLDDRPSDGARPGA